MNIEAYLYDVSGHDEKIKIEDVDIGKLGEKKLLWIDVKKKDKKTLDTVIAALDLENLPSKSILEESHRPVLDKFENFFRFCIDSVVTKDEASPEKLTIDFIVGKNFVVTIHEGEADYFREFRDREKGETQFGEMDAESFVATLLDLHIVSYFRALEQIERRVDDLDEEVLKTDMDSAKFLSAMVSLRGDVSKLRRWFTPHRDVIYALSRADFQQIAESDSVDQYKMLNQHFESAVDAIESSRETVLSIFELYATKSAEMTNSFIQRLTFITLVMGALGVVAGTLGMNYKVDFFDSPSGFWITLAGMIVVAVSLTIFARIKRWI